VPTANFSTSNPGLFQSAGPTTLDAPTGTIGGLTPSGSQGSGYIVRWAAPTTTSVHLDADLWNLLASTNFNRYEVRLVRNSGSVGTTVLERGGILLPAQGVNSTNRMPVAVSNISVNAGDYIDFFVGRADGTPGEFVGFDLKISDGAHGAPSVNYLHSAAADFYADFVNGLPQHNPNSDWSFFGPNWQTSDLEPNPDPGSVAGSGTGWRVKASAGGGVLYSYARGNNTSFTSVPQTILGHGPMVATWTAPADIDMGGIELSGLLTQSDFEPTRQMQLRVYKNDSVDPFVTVNASFVAQRAVVSIPATRVAMQPGDTLLIVVDGSGPQGNGVPTFASWDVIVKEIDSQTAADFNGDHTVSAADLAIWKANAGMAAGAAKSQGDANGDGAVNGADLLVWQRQLGGSIDGGVTPFVYHPGAIIVQTTGVTLPDGSQLDITGTQTQGLQEAINYSAAEGFDVFVLPGTYNLNAHLDLAALQDRAFRLEDVTMNFTSNVTDWGIRFDSTMITDWYWKGGALNAPNAASAVLFQPRTPHPLDGEIYGTVGVVDSRFDFGIPITAQTYKVTMNTTQAAVNDAALSFLNISKNQIHYVGSGFSPTNIFVAPRMDDPIPFDLFATAGRVTVIAPIGEIFESGPRSTAIVVKPDGTRLNTFGTKTSGLKEAYDYAAAHNLDLLVFGRGVRNVDPHSQFGYYNTNDTITVGPLAGRTYEQYSVTYNYTQTGTALKMSDIVASHFELTGQIVAPNATIGVQIKPTTTGVLNSIVRIQHVVGAQTNVILDPSVQTIDSSEFHLHEMNIGQYGIVVVNPSASTYFSNNYVRSVHDHAMSNVALQLGQSGANASHIQFNTIILRTALDFGGSGNIALQVFGANNNIDLEVFGPHQSVGARFETSSSGNALTYGPVNATTPIINLGMSNTLIARSTAAVSPLSTSSSTSSVSAALLAEEPSAAVPSESLKAAAAAETAKLSNGPAIRRTTWRPRFTRREQLLDRVFEQLWN
jgi:hypothetical protein